MILDSEKFNGQPVIKWVAPIDHSGGEKSYPVGWPRMYLYNFSRFKPAIPSNWQEWDYFEFDVKMTLAGDPENKSCPVTLMLFSSAPQHNVALTKMHDGKIHRIKIPVDRLTDPAKITRIGFSIYEGNYKHGAKLSVQAGNFHLSRSKECTVDKVTLLTPAVTAADSAVKLSLRTSGPSGDVARGVPIQLTEALSGKILRKETLPVQRGEKELEVEIAELDLAPGDYKLTFFPGEKQKSQSVVFKLLSSPYKVKK